jgi:hypothetical protein
LNIVLNRSIIPFQSTLLIAEELEVVQKRVLKIISPQMAYCEALEHFRLSILLYSREERICETKSLLRKSLTTRRIDFTICCFRRVRLVTIYRHFNMCNRRTNRFQNSFIPAMCSSLETIARFNFLNDLW